MLSATKEERRLQVVSPVRNIPSLAGFGKVLNSIHGLQQRLDDFSVDDISEATEKARTLAIGLSELQRRLAVLTKINHSIATVQTAVDRASKEASELIKLEGFDGPLQLQAIVQANKLIRFPRVAKVAKSAAVHPVTKDSPTHFSQTETLITTENPNEVPIENSSLQINAAEDTFPSSETTKAGPGVEVTASEAVVAAADVQETRLDERGEVLTEPLSSSDQASEVDPLATHDTGSEPMVHSAPATEPAIENLESIVSEEETKALVPANTDFDQRLLDDLIKNYGEFAVSSNVPATITPAKDSAKNKRPEEPIESKGRAEPSANKNVPSVKKRGELDRQLKKIIKDYGEYDIYSHQSSVKLKMGVVGAFLLLGAIFSGFYFFSTPKANETKQPVEVHAGESQDIQNSSSLKQKK
jgi:hypothetical protein